MSNPVVLLSTTNDGSMYNRHNDTDPNVIKNRTDFLKQHGIDMSQTTRVNPNMLVRDKELHDTNFCRYIEVGKEQQGLGMYRNDIDDADGLITREAGHALIAPVADCIGAVIYDPRNEILMLSHLGRQSLEQQGGVKSVQYLKEHYGSDPTDLKVWMTPAPSKEAYPIWKLDNKGMKEVMFEQLNAAGILVANVHDDPTDSDKSPLYYSYTNFFNGRSNEDGDHMMVAMMTN